MRYGRRVLVLIFFCIFCALFTLSCGESAGNSGMPDSKGKEQYKTQSEPVFTVNFIDVGEGDCTVITLPDGKVFMIDCGVKTERNLKTVRNFLYEHKIEEIDYFVLSTVNEEHIGNAVEILNRFTVKRAYIPDVRYKNAFYTFGKTYNALTEKGVEIKISQAFDKIEGDNYRFVFMSPPPSNMSESSYYSFNLSREPSEKNCNDISPIIFFECLDVRFLFTGDATSSEEDKVVSNYKVGLFSRFNVKLERIEFLKVGHHGDKDASGLEFLELVNPDNAIISVGGDNRFSHPSTSTLLRLQTVNPEYALYRTDRDGTLCVSVDNNGKYTLSTQVE